MKIENMNPSLDLFKVERNNVICGFKLTVFDCLELRGDVVQGSKGLFVSYPGKISKDPSGKWQRDYSHWEFTNYKDQAIIDIKNWIVEQAKAYTGYSEACEKESDQIPF